MPSPFRILGYAIVSADGMIADARAVMPDALMFEADKKFFERELDEVDAVVHGRNSYEHQPNSPRRRRLIMTRKVTRIVVDPDHAHAFLWNPAATPFEEACGALGLTGGTIGVLGGTDVFDLFLARGYDLFQLSRAEKVKLPGGTPVFSAQRAGHSIEATLAEHGLQPGPKRVLDAVDSVSVVGWRRDGGGAGRRPLSAAAG
jgi:dihydrofolate reductase